MPRPLLSLLSTGRFFVAASVAYAVLAACLSFTLLKQIENDARLIRDRQIPKILSQNSNAVKVENLASLTRSAYLARDPRLERQVLLEMRVLSQTFSLDGDQVLVDGAKSVAEDVKTLIALRTAERSGAVGEAADAPTLRATYDDAMRTVRRLADHLTSDTALVADTVSKQIETNAARVTRVWFTILAVPVAGALFLFWTFRRHVARPIEATIGRLTEIGTQRFTGAAPPKPLFVELRMIAEAVETYGELSVKLGQTNAVLRALAVQDALTGIGNRRSFDAMLLAEFETASSRGASLAVLLLDIDHFKRINDKHGHQAGDVCLQAVGAILRRHCEGTDCHAARYGGEEFAVLLPGRGASEAAAFAETLRLAIEAAPVSRGEAREAIRMTASIGVAALDDGAFGSLSALFEGADAALYRAKRLGRNNVQLCRDAGAEIAPEGRRRA